MTIKFLPLLLPLLLLGACAQRQPVTAPLPPLPPPPSPAQLTLVVAPQDEVTPLLAYHQSLRRMTQGELLKELSNLAQLPKTPKAQLQSAMVLSLTRGNGDLARAQAQFEVVASAPEPEAQGLRQLAQMLSAQCADTRRLLDDSERLRAQLKDNQRKNEQLNETLEALKEIERGLPARASK
ncbi:hypothetical protein GM658_13145 [Pseudoduganella eburnea]|uniref:Permease n=1 Tax=Massilia eburnea TaxID=1776165 RepID=A0A6L6QH48_9BURK|nr:hypothetical protein [Massilia eburnea]MTW11545.1 hypothetical protein [Massilia eburnea]